MASRPIVFKCPNYQDCLTGYRGEDIEVCPECGSVLQEVKKQTPAYVAYLINLTIVAAFAGALWLAWPWLSALLTTAQRR